MDRPFRGLSLALERVVVSHGTFGSMLRIDVERWNQATPRRWPCSPTAARELQTSVGGATDVCRWVRGAEPLRSVRIAPPAQLR